MLNKWHLSDHRPITLVIGVETNTDLSGLLKRAADLNDITNELSIQYTSMMRS